jgi:hypothetical protein
MTIIRHRLLAILLLGLLLTGCLGRSGLEMSGTVEGKALIGRERAAGVAVDASRHMGVPGKEEHYTARADGDGTFNMDLPRAPIF